MRKECRKGCLAFAGHLILYILLLSPAAGAQKYPAWFLTPAASDCLIATPGVMLPSARRDSLTLAAGYDLAIRQLTRMTHYTAVLRNLYVGYDGGKIWMDFTYQENFDSALYKSLHQRYKVASAWFTSGLSVVAAGSDSCEEDVLLDIIQLPEPDWIKVRPQNDGYITGIGVSVRYFNEASSWNRAFDEALKDMLKQLFLKSKALVKKSGSDFETIFSEEFTGRITNISVIGRWLDTDSDLFYVYLKGTP